MFIRLTDLLNNPILIAVNKIVKIEVYELDSKIYFDDGSSEIVKEPIEQIRQKLYKGSIITL